jgi:hypothetical protein
MVSFWVGAMIAAARKMTSGLRHCYRLAIRFRARDIGSAAQLKKGIRPKKRRYPKALKVFHCGTGSGGPRYSAYGESQRARHHAYARTMFVEGRRSGPARCFLSDCGGRGGL